MDLQLSGKRALVTGSTSGIGEGIAKVLTHEGASVVIHGRNKQQADSIVDEINNTNSYISSRDSGKAYVAIGDLSKDEGAKEVVRESQRLVVI
jgi:3-oxoacyl-[acyl-carrier protein] reductase